MWPTPAATALFGSQRQGRRLQAHRRPANEFGSDRVFNSPLAEANIVGRAVGYATRGMKPVVEIQFFDYIWPAMHQIRNELALMRWRSNGEWAAPRRHSRAHRRLSHRRLHLSLAVRREHLHAHPRPARRLPVQRARRQRPSAHRHPLRRPGALPRTQAPLSRTYGRAPYPGPDYAIPFRQSQNRSPGSHITLVTYGAVVPRACRPPKSAQREFGIDVEVIDLRTLNPYDWEAIATSVRKTSRVIVAHEDMISWGYGAEIAARIADELFDLTSTPPSAASAPWTPSSPTSPSSKT
jgi:2-oxoisovalerate dehydrogenase E1 component